MALSERIQQMFSIDLRTLALVRVCFGLIILSDLIQRSQLFTLLYSEHGVLPRVAALSHAGSWRFSFHLLNAHGEYQLLLMAFLGLAALALLVGYRTRTAIIVCWLLLASLDNRNRLVLQGGDTLLLVMLFWSIFLPLSARFSVDAALNSRPRLSTNRYFSVATVALLLQAMYVYVFGALLKTDPAWIPNGHAVHYALSLEQFALPLGIWLRQWTPLLTLITYFVWWLELMAPLLIFFPWYNLPIRLLTVFLLIVMHLGFLLTLHIGLFPYISITSLLLFLPGPLWDWISTRTLPNWRSRRSKVRIFYDGNCDLSRKACLLLRTFCLPSSVSVLPAQDDPHTFSMMQQHSSWVVYDADDQSHFRWQAVNFVLKQSLVFYPLGLLFAVPPIRQILDLLYDLISRKRTVLSGLADHWLPYRPMFERTTLPVSVLVVALTMLVFYVNVARLPQVALPIPVWLRDGAMALNLWQSWGMFAPRPNVYDGWYVIPGKLKDGTRVDAYTASLDPPDFTEPEDVVVHYGSNRERKLLFRLSLKRQSKYRKYYSRYLCRQWQSLQPGSPELAHLTVYYMRYRVPAPGEPTPKPKRVLLHEHTCN